MNRRNFLKAVPALAAIPMIPQLTPKPEVKYYEDTDWVDPEYSHDRIESWRIIWAYKPPVGGIHRLWADSINPQFKLEIVFDRPSNDKNVPHWLTINKIKGNREVIARLAKYRGLNRDGQPEPYRNLCKAMDKWLLNQFGLTIEVIPL